MRPSLHVHMCRVTDLKFQVLSQVPDLKNGWTDCAQIWYTDRDQLLGCRESQLEAPSRSSALAGLNLSFARLSPPKGVLLA